MAILTNWRTREPADRARYEPAGLPMRAAIATEKTGRVKRKSYVNVMVLLCIVYGALIGILAMTSTADLGLIATIGAVLLGLGWTGMGMFTKPQR